MVTRPAPSPEIAVVLSFLKALEAHDVDLALTYLAPEVEYQNMPLPALRGPAGVARFLRPALKMTHSFEASIKHIAANGAVVLTERTDSFMVGPVRVPFPICGTFRVQDGQIVSWRDTFDWTTLVVNTLLAGPLYLLRRTAMVVALKAAARK